MQEEEEEEEERRSIRKGISTKPLPKRAVVPSQFFFT